MDISLNVLNRQFQLYQEEYEEAAIRVLRSGWYILGPELEAFEGEFARYVGSKYCVGVNSGLDALVLAVKALGIGEGDEVIVPANTYIATVLAVTANGAMPIPVEPDEYYNMDSEKLASAITERTKAILAVHLYGQSADMDSIRSVAEQYGLHLLEDCAQSHGARYHEAMTGTFGEVGCFSFYPTKNLGAFGDAGAVVTDSEGLYQQLCMLRNYGSRVKYHNKIEGVNSRLDELQAALLRVKLSHLDELIAERRKIASQYLRGIGNPLLRLPVTRKGAEHVYHQFVVRTRGRDYFQEYLNHNGISTVIHYPIPPHLAECYHRLGYQKGDFPITERYAGEVLSLPMFNGMRQEEIEYVIQVCNNYVV